MLRTLVAISVLLFTACGGTSDSSMQQERSGGLSVFDSTYISELEGKWRSSCDPAPQVSWSYDQVVTVKANRIEIAENTYRGTTCSQLEYSTTSVSLFSVARPSNELDGIFIDKKLEAYLWTVFNPNEVQGRYNDGGFCGYRDWVVNVPKDCSGKAGGDQFFPSKSSVKYNIFKVEGTVAYFGTSDADDETQRETKVNRNVLFQKVN